MSRRVFGEVGLQTLLADLKEQFDTKADLVDGRLSAAQMPSIGFNDLTDNPLGTETVDGFEVTMPADKTDVTTLNVGGNTYYRVGDGITMDKLVGSTMTRVRTRDGTIVDQESFQLTEDEKDVQTFVPDAAHVIAQGLAFNCCVDEVTIDAVGITVQNGLYFGIFDNGDGMLIYPSSLVRETETIQHRLSYNDLNDRPCYMEVVSESYDFSLPDDPSSLPSYQVNMGAPVTMRRVGDPLSYDELAGAIMTRISGTVIDGEIVDSTESQQDITDERVQQDGYILVASGAAVSVLTDGIEVGGVSWDAGLYFMQIDETDGSTTTRVVVTRLSRDQKTEAHPLPPEFVGDVNWNKLSQRPVITSYRYTSAMRGDVMKFGGTRFVRIGDALSRDDLIGAQIVCDVAYTATIRSAMRFQLTDHDVFENQLSNPALVVAMTIPTDDQGATAGVQGIISSRVDGECAYDDFTPVPEGLWVADYLLHNFELVKQIPVTAETTLSDIAWDHIVDPPFGQIRNVEVVVLSADHSAVGDSLSITNGDSGTYCRVSQYMPIDELYDTSVTVFDGSTDATYHTIVTSHTCSNVSAVCVEHPNGGDLPLLISVSEATELYGASFTAGLWAIGLDDTDSYITITKSQPTLTKISPTLLPESLLIVTLSPGAEEGQFIGDATYSDIHNAYMNHQRVNVVMPGTGAFDVISSMQIEGGSYVVMYPNLGESSLSVTAGNASDYFTVGGE